MKPKLYLVNGIKMTYAKAFRIIHGKGKITRQSRRDVVAYLNYACLIK